MIRATRNMLDFFERKGMKYSPDIDTTKAGKDVVTVTYTGDNKDTIRFKIFVDPDEDNVAIRVWTIAKTTNTRQVAAVSLVLNDLKNNMDISRIPNPTEKDEMRLKKYEAALQRMEERGKG